MRGCVVTPLLLRQLIAVPNHQKFSEHHGASVNTLRRVGHECDRLVVWVELPILAADPHALPEPQVVAIRGVSPRNVQTEEGIGKHLDGPLHVCAEDQSRAKIQEGGGQHRQIGRRTSQFKVRGPKGL